MSKKAYEVYMAQSEISEGVEIRLHLRKDQVHRSLVQNQSKSKGGRGKAKRTANKELRYLRSLFNFAKHPTRNWIDHNPTQGIDFLPVEKKIKYVLPKEDVLRVIMVADSDTQDYLWTIALTLGRMSEITRLTWPDVNLKSAM